MKGIMRLISFVLSLLLTLQPLMAEGTNPEKVIVVFDASGSMWGQVSGKTKIEIAKEAVTKLSDESAEKVELGLVAYGHRRKGDCSDIETLVPAAKANKAAMKKAIKAINPVGKTPLSDAVVKAAEELKYTEQKATIILVSDGLESCDKDPCKIAESLEQKGVDFTAHIVGFDIASKEEQKQLSCIATSTGGRFFEAKDLESLSASLSTAVEKTVEATGLKLVAKMSEESEPLTKVSWTVFSPETDFNGKRERVTFSYHAQPIFRLDPGKYLIEAKSGSAKVQREIEVVAAKNLTETVILGAGKIKLLARESEGSEPINEGLSWRVLTAEADFNGKRQQIAHSYNKQPIFSLPAGDYLVEVKKGSARVQKKLSIQAGQEEQEEVLLGAGVLRLKALYKEDGEQVADGLSWTVLAPEADFDGNRAKIAHSYNSIPTFTIPAGKYRLHVKRGAAQLSKEIEIEAGKKREMVVTMDAAQLKPELLFVEGGERVTGGLSWTVYAPELDFDGNRPKIVHSYNDTPHFTLNSGEYLLEIKRGAARARVQLELAAGDKIRKQVVLGGGQIKLKALLSEGGTEVAGGLSWTVFAPELDFNGKRDKFAHSYNNTPAFTLNSGDYLLEVKRGASVTRKNFSIAAGDSKQLAVSMDSGVRKFKAVESAGSDAVKVKDWTIFLKEEGAEAPRKVAHSFNATPEFTLRAGEYTAQVRLGQQIRRTDLKVDAGSQENIEVVLTSEEG